MNSLRGIKLCTTYALSCSVNGLACSIYPSVTRIVESNNDVALGARVAFKNMDTYAGRE